jgi:predicted phage tail protein
VHDFGQSLWDTLSDIARAGRAAPRHDGVKWTVVIDRPQTTVIGHLTPRNSWGFSGERPYTRFPDGFRVTFPDETNGYQSAERIVPWPGFVGDPEVTEEIQFPGITNPDLIYIETRRRMYELILRLDTYTVNQDFEALVLARGDLSVLNHDVLDRVQMAARVREVDGNTVVLDTQVTVESGHSYACRFRLADGTTLLKTVLNSVFGDVFALSLNFGPMPAVGDLALFGLAGAESREVIVKNVERADNLTARLTLIDHAPQIATLLAADVIPAWTRASG